MPLCAVGLNHVSAPLEVRERVVFPLETLQQALLALTEVSSIHEAAVISTCNRTEIYTLVETAADADQIVRWLASCHEVEEDWLRSYLYVHHGRDVVTHLLRVTPGLDSLVVGEPQIGGQTKAAYLEALTAGTVGQVLDRLFQHAFTVSKRIRTETGIGANPVSVAFAAVTLARQIFGSLEQSTALLVGAGETIELTARHLYQQGVRRFMVANRTLERARELAEQYGGEAVELGALPDALVHADIVVASTASPLPLLGKGSVERALKKRRHRPIFMVDIAVPRDIEPEVGQLDDVYLYTVDDLREVIEENMRSRRHAADEAQEIIDLQADRFMNWLRSLESVPAIRRFRDRATDHRDLVLERALRRLDRGEPPEDVLKYLAHTLTNRLLHGPTTRLRQAGEEGERELMEAARRLLDIDETAAKRGNTGQ
ncbi:MAG: glutamyl-tRNA reductase [Aquisalimonadaceae bacterium]